MAGERDGRPTFLIVRPDQEPPQKPPKVSAEVRRERARQAFEMSMMGFPISRIREEVGFSSNRAARNAIAKQMADYLTDDVTPDQAFEQAFVDKLIQSVTPAAFRGDIRAVDMALRLAQARSRTRGMDSEIAPSEFSVVIQRKAEELAELRAQKILREREQAEGEPDIVDGEIVDETG